MSAVPNGPSLVGRGGDPHFGDDATDHGVANEEFRTVDRAADDDLPSIVDAQQLDEIHLLTSLMIAASAHTAPFTQDEVDRLLERADLDDSH
jgi:hypothetical protein